MHRNSEVRGGSGRHPDKEKDFKWERGAERLGDK